MMMFISSSDAVRNRMGTREVRRTVRQKSKPVPSGRETSSTSRSQASLPQRAFASASVRAVVMAKPSLRNAKVSPVTRLASSSNSKMWVIPCSSLFGSSLVLFYGTGSAVSRHTKRHRTESFCAVPCGLAHSALYTLPIVQELDAEYLAWLRR